eukprot:1810212-Heterocapsa_arctica.AAC.1
MICIRIEHAIGGGWSSRRRPRVSAVRANPHPRDVPPPSTTEHAHAAHPAAGFGEDHRLCL